MTTGLNHEPAQAKRLATVWAKILFDDHFDWHRGAVHVGHGYRALFGNDCYRQDARAKAEVRLVRKRLKELGIEPEGFGLGPGGYTWVLLVKHPRTKELDMLVWKSWFEACGLPNVLKDAA